MQHPVQTIGKLDFTEIRHQKQPFTTYLNKVIQNLDDGFALGVYCFLGSLPHTWKINREHLKDHFKVGREKIGAALAYLNEKKLITYIRDRLPDGTLGPVIILFNTGEEFIKDLEAKNPENLDSIEVEATPRKTRIVVNSTTLRQNQRVVKPHSGKTAPINTTINTKETKLERGALSADFFPSEETKRKALALELTHADLNAEHKKFYEHYMNSGVLSDDWNKQYTMWMFKAEQFWKSKRANATSTQNNAKNQPATQRSIPFASEVVANTEKSYRAPKPSPLLEEYMTKRGISIQ